MLIMTSCVYFSVGASWSTDLSLARTTPVAGKAMRPFGFHRGLRLFVGVWIGASGVDSIMNA